MEWIGLIALIVILWKTLEKGGDWFDFLQTNARYENWWINFKFNAIFVILCIAVIGLGVWIWFQAVGTETPPSLSNQSTVVSQTRSSNSEPVRSTKTHTQHVHHKPRSK